jgi:hypothetical protein
MMMPHDGGCLRRLVDRCSTTGGSTAFLVPHPYLPSFFFRISRVANRALLDPAFFKKSAVCTRTEIHGWLAGGTGLIAASGGLLFLLTEDDAFSAEEPTTTHVDMRITYSI